MLPVIFTTATQFFSLPPYLLEAVCLVESGHKASAISLYDGSSPSYGICQVKLETARQMGFKGTKEQLMKPNRNIYYAAKYLRYQLNRYGNIESALVAYNQGSVKSKKSTPYSKKVRKAWKEAKK